MVNDKLRGETQGVDRAGRGGIAGAWENVKRGERRNRERRIVHKMAKIPGAARKHGKEKQEETKRAREVVGEGRGCGIKGKGLGVGFFVSRQTPHASKRRHSSTCKPPRGGLVIRHLVKVTRHAAERSGSG